MAGIYIHIPFCKQACSYCDFYFVTQRKLIPDFHAALLREIEAYRGSRMTSEPITTIYIGGGTPSLLSPDQLEKIMAALDSVFNLQPEEVTLEMNPDDVHVDYLRGVRNAGITRASMGIQSFDELLLGFMHRAHTAAEAEQALEALQKAGFKQFTADLIYGNPGQTEEMVAADIRRLMAYSPPHVSAYSLTIEPGTRIGKQVDLGRLRPPDEEEVERHFDLVRSELQSYGLEPYEISNFAKPECEAIHNSNYWRHVNYIGLGPSAHSLWWKEGRSAAHRWKNSSDFKSYCRTPETLADEKEELALPELAEERIMLALRTREGITMHELEEAYRFRFSSSQAGWMEARAEEGLMDVTDQHVRLTTKGFKIADYLTAELLSR
ncbi:MAG: radical SAM family heme chaperone HemW [Balneolaceae bacterium]